MKALPLHILTLCLGITFLSVGELYAQEPADDDYQTVPGKRFRKYTHEGEEFLYGTIDGVEITRPYPSSRELRQGRRKIERFTKLQWYVHSVYPYAQGVADLMAEVERDIQNIPDKQAQKEYIKEKEAALFSKYEDDFRRMSRKQGKILVKLIYRQAGVSAYEMIKDTKSGATAFFWNGIGRLFGINLKEDFDPEEDAMINSIVRDLDNGGYNIAYKSYNYRLP